jgi:hypothetical protein
MKAGRLGFAVSWMTLATTMSCELEAAHIVSNMTKPINRQSCPGKTPGILARANSNSGHWT